MPKKNTSPKILVVDDELSMREYLEILLEKEGYPVFSAENGKKALSMLEKTPYDLILLDIRLGPLRSHPPRHPPRRPLGDRCPQGGQGKKPGNRGHHDLRICLHRNRRGSHERRGLRLRPQAL